MLIRYEQCEDQEIKEMADYYFFLKEFNVKPWELDKMDTVLVQGLKQMRREIVRREREELNNHARR